MFQELNPYIFRGYDIRGVVPKDINQNTAYLIGKGFGSKLVQLQKDKCVVGYDNRLSSPMLHEALVKGITECGIDVYDLHLTTTPMYYFACLYLKINRRWRFHWSRRRNVYNSNWRKNFKSTQINIFR